jgi:hypothetical protein
MVLALVGDSTMTSRRAPFADESAPAPALPRALPRRGVGLVFAATLSLPHISQTPGGYRRRPTDFASPIRSLIGGTERIYVVADSPTLIESSLPASTIKVMAEYSYLVITLPRGTSRDAARQILTDHAEYGDWELARLHRFADGSRTATLRRRIIRQSRPVELGPLSTGFS